MLNVVRTLKLFNKLGIGYILKGNRILFNYHVINFLKEYIENC